MVFYFGSNTTLANEKTNTEVKRIVKKTEFFIRHVEF